MSFNVVFVMSVTVAAVLDLLAPQAAYLAWLCLVLAALVLTALVFELLHQRSDASANASANALYARLPGWLRLPSGPRWNLPGWRMIGINAFIALGLRRASKSSAASGDLIASTARNLRNVQVLLPGLNQKRNDSLNCWSCL